MTSRSRTNRGLAKRGEAYCETLLDWLLDACRTNCEKMRELASLMKTVQTAKTHCDFPGAFYSAASSGSLDRIMGELVYMLGCESACGMDLALAVASGKEVELPMFFDADGNYPKEGGE